MKATRSLRFPAGPAQPTAEEPRCLLAAVLPGRPTQRLAQFLPNLLPDQAGSADAGVTSPASTNLERLDGAAHRQVRLALEDLGQGLGRVGLEGREGPRVDRRLMSLTLLGCNDYPKPPGQKGVDAGAGPPGWRRRSAPPHGVRRSPRQTWGSVLLALKKQVRSIDDLSNSSPCHVALSIVDCGAWRRGEGSAELPLADRRQSQPPNDNAMADRWTLGTLLPYSVATGDDV